MMESIIASLVTGILSFCGVMFTNVAANKKIEANLITAQAVTDTKIENLDSKITELANEVRKTQLFADRITKLEVEVESIKKAIGA